MQVGLAKITILDQYLASLRVVLPCGPLVPTGVKTGSEYCVHKLRNRGTNKHNDR